MKKINTIKELCEYIWYLEKKYDLLNLEINQIHPWASFRMDIYYKIGKEIGLFDQQFSHKTSIKNKISNLIYFIKNSILHNSSQNLKKQNVLVFSHPVSKRKNKQYIDIHTHYLINDLIKKKIKFIEFESPHQGKHIREHKIYKKYLDNIFILRNIKNIFTKVSLSKEVKNILDKLNNELKESINISFDIKKFLIQNTKKFIPTYNMYHSILRKTKPKKIFLVISYGRGELIKAARDLKIEVIEIQHGTFSKYHLGYSFPDKVNLNYFPNKFMVWNNYWKKLINLPINNENIIIHPFKYLEKQKQKYNNINKKKNTLIIFSQGGLANKIIKKITHNQSYFKSFEITFKLHPNEYHMLSEYSNLISFKKSNIKIVTEINLHKNLAAHEYQGGIFSTALYEGVEFNCKTILFDLPGIEYMEKFIKNYKPIII